MDGIGQLILHSLQERFAYIGCGRKDVWVFPSLYLEIGNSMPSPSRSVIRVIVMVHAVRLHRVYRPSSLFFKWILAYRLGVSACSQDCLDGMFRCVIEISLSRLKQIDVRTNVTPVESLRLIVTPVAVHCLSRSVITVCVSSGYKIDSYMISGTTVFGCRKAIKDRFNAHVTMRKGACDYALGDISDHVTPSPCEYHDMQSQTWCPTRYYHTQSCTSTPAQTKFSLQNSA